MHSKVPIYVALFVAILLTAGFNFPKGGESGAATGLGTGTGTTGSPPFTSSGNIIYAVNMSERKSASSYGYFSSTWQTLNDRHCVGVQFHSESWSYGSSPPPNVASITQTQRIYVAQGTELGSIPGGTSLNNGSAYGTAPSGVSGGEIAVNNDIVIQTSDTGAIASGRTLGWYIETTTVTVYNDATPTATNHSWSSLIEYDLIKLEVDDAALTTRKIYGQPNRDGQLSADPNSPLRYPNYNPWDFKGGIFIGNMPGGDKDGSGTARTAFFVQGGSSYVSTYEFAALSVYDMGKPSDSGITGALDVGLYLPDSGDTYISSLNDGNVNWDHQWDITPGDVDLGSSDFTEHPFSYKTLTNGNSDDYLVFPLTKVFGTGSKPATALTGFVLAIVDEATAISGNDKCWHYLASAEHETGSTFPRNDCAPRVWLVTPTP